MEKINYQKKIKTFINRHWFGIFVILIITLSIFLRFYNYENRWALASDQARDALVGREALGQHKIPIIGPFSSAGVFVTGPQWYWLIALATSIYPGYVLMPWIALTLSFVLAVYIMILIGTEISGKLFGLILGLLTAVSPSQIAQSTNLTNPSAVVIFSVLSVYFCLRYIKTGKSFFIFLFTFFISLSINMHFQSIGLLIMIPIALFMRKPKMKQLAYLMGGLIIPFIPLIIFDLNNGLYNTRGIIDYYLYGQYRIYVPNRWLTYALVYWPSAWSHIIGGPKEFGYFIILLLTSFVFYFGVIKRAISKQILLFILSFACIFLILRYYRGERFDAYILFTHPFVITLTGWVIYNLYNFKKYIGLALLLLILAGSLTQNAQLIKNSTNQTALTASNWKDKLIRVYPNRKFSVYDLKGENKSLSLPLSLFLDVDDKISNNGIKIGFIVEDKEKVKYPAVIEMGGGYQLFDLSKFDKNYLLKEGWFIMNPEAIYHSTEEWYVGKKLNTFWDGSVALWSLIKNRFTN